MFHEVTSKKNTLESEQFEVYQDHCLPTSINLESLIDQENNSKLGRAGRKASSGGRSSDQQGVAASHLVATPHSGTTAAAAKFPQCSAAGRTAVTVASPSNNANIRIDPPSFQHQRHLSQQQQQQFFNFKDPQPENPQPLYQSSNDQSFELRHHQSLGSNPHQGQGLACHQLGQQGQQLSDRQSDSCNMDYAWLEPRHDPIATDTNLAEIDFENFKNEDLAYAFSCGEEESGGSSTDMSVCRSEPLFSSMRDSEMQSELNNPSVSDGHPKGAAGVAHGVHAIPPGPQDLSLIQDSLTDEDFNFSEKVTVNKNNYTLTFSGQGVIGSFIASMVSSTGAILEPQDPREPTGPLGLLHTSSTRFNQDRSLESPGKLTTWSNLSKSPSGFQQSPPQPVIWQSRNREELNNNSASDAAENYDSRRTKSLPSADFELDPSPKDARLVNAFIRGRSSDKSDPAYITLNPADQTLPLYNNDDPGGTLQQQMIRSKDTVNQYLKTNSKLPLIEENAEATGLGSGLSGASSEVVSSGSTLRQMNSPKRHANAQQRPLSLPPKPQIKFLRKTKSLSTPNGSKQDTPGTGKRYAYPDLDFLENDVGLWDTFFSHGKNSSKFQSVLRPPLPIDEYLKQKSNPSGGGSAETPVCSHNLPPKTGSTPSENPKPIIYDSASLRTLLPAAQKHLVPKIVSESRETNSSRSSPITQVCQSLSKLHNNAERSYTTKNNPEMPDCMVASAGSGTDVKLVKVKQAWTASPEAATSIEVVVRRRKKSEPAAGEEHEQRNLNVINNNNNGSLSEAAADLNNLKRRSYIPQDYLSQVLDPTTSADIAAALATSSRLKRKDFPKSGSQNDLVDSWRDESSEATGVSSQTTSEAIAGANARWNTPPAPTSHRHLSAEYPFHKNLCMPPQGINFDLTHKRGLFVNLYSAVERLLMYQDDATGSETSVRYILFHELCPALMAIMKDGLKPEVITSFGRMQTNVWRLVEALTRMGPSLGGGAATSDLVMLLNAKFAAAGEDHRKFTSFIAGLLNMSSLHVWFSKLKWNMDVLLRFYERHAFICALHKETRLLFDELVFCLQRLYSVPIHIDLPFSSDIIEMDIPLTSTTPTSGTGSNPGYCCSQTSAHCCCSNVCSASTSETGNSSQSPPHSGGTNVLMRRPLSAASKSRIPRPISLPKRLESKLGSGAVNIRRTRQSPVRGSKDLQVQRVRASPTAGPVRPTMSATQSDRKSRVRDTVKLFDSKTSTDINSPTSAESADPKQRSTADTTNSSNTRRSGSANKKRHSLKSPKTGAGEAMALEDTGGRR